MITARVLNYVLIALLGILVLLWIFWPTTRPDWPAPDKTDSVTVNHPIHITQTDPIKRFPPTTVYVYVPDTLARAKVEKQDIITDVSIQNGLIDVEKISPRGVGIKQEYHIPQLAGIRIDGQGMVVITDDKKARHKAWWQKVGRRALLVGTFVGGIFIGTHL